MLFGSLTLGVRTQSGKKVHGWPEPLAVCHSTQGVEDYLTVSGAYGGAVGTTSATVAACNRLGETSSYRQPGHLRKLHVPNTGGYGHSQNGDQ